MKTRTLPSITYALLLAVALPAQNDDLGIEFDGGSFHVTEGLQSESVALIAGLERIEQPLNGGGVLRVNPLLMLAVGQFDADGSFAHNIEALLDGIEEPLTIYVQAVSLRDGFFRTSQEVTLHLGTKDPEEDGGAASGGRVWCGGGKIPVEEVDPDDPDDRADPRSVEVVDPEDPEIMPVDEDLAACRSDR